MRLLIATDAWLPQVNGVVRTLVSLGEELIRLGHVIRMVTPEGRTGLPMPFYPEIRLTFATAANVISELQSFGPDAIHIATEGPIGWATRRACIQCKVPFTTSYHTQFAKYVQARMPIPGVEAMTWATLQHFHNRAQAVMVPTLSIAQDLTNRGFRSVKVWGRGVDHQIFKPTSRNHLNLPRPILLYAGRVAIEKNIEAFLKISSTGSKVVVGDGPDRKRLEKKYRDVLFTGYRHSEDYARTLSSADVLVFPSHTDTFGLVMIEAIACGTPVAAFNVPSPVDVISNGISGALGQDLSSAIKAAIKLDRQRVHQEALKFTWSHTAEMFLSWIAPFSSDNVTLLNNRASPILHLR